MSCGWARVADDAAGTEATVFPAAAQGSHERSPSRRRVLRAFVPSPWRAVMRVPGDERSGAFRSVRPRVAGGRRFGLAADVEPAAESRPSDRFIFGHLVTRGVRYWRRAIDQALAERGLSQATAMPLLVLARLGDDLRQGGNADELELEGPSPVRIVDMQLAEGLVSRLEDPDDRSANLLSRFLKNVSDEDLAVIVRGLAKVEAVLVSELSA